MASSLALNWFFFEGLQVIFANQVCPALVIHNRFWKDKGHMCINNFYYFTFAFFFNILSDIHKNRRNGGGGMCPKSLPPEIKILTVLQFILFCPIIFGPSPIPSIHMCTIHKSYTYTCNFCLSPLLH